MLVELIPFAILAIFLVAFGLLIRRGIRLKREIGRFWPRLEEEAASLGYRSAPDEADVVCRALEDAPRFARSTVSAPHLLAKRGRGARRYLADYRAAPRSGGSSRESGVLFAVRLDDRRLPRFALHHSPVKMPNLVLAGLDRVIQLRYPGFEWVPLDTTSPALANSLLYAEQRDTAMQALTADVVDVLGRSEGWAIESTGGWLLADRHDRGQSKPGDPSAVLAELAQFDAIATAFES